MTSIYQYSYSMVSNMIPTKWLVCTNILTQWPAIWYLLNDEYLPTFLLNGQQFDIYLMMSIYRCSYSMSTIRYLLNDEYLPIFLLNVQQFDTYLMISVFQYAYSMASNYTYAKSVDNCTDEPMGTECETNFWTKYPFCSVTNRLSKEVCVSFTSN